MKDCTGEEQTCTRVSMQYAQVQLPVTVDAFAQLGEVQTQCCGEPEIVREEGPCGCKLYITQNLSIRIPVQYSSSVTAGDSRCCCTYGE